MATDVSPSADLRGLSDIRRRTDRLLDKRDDRVNESQKLAASFQELNAYLGIADQVTTALEQLSEQLFQQLLGVVEEKLTVALQEILEQPIRLRADATIKSGAAAIKFWIERSGQREDILQGQGGSVANVLSVGLRMFALTTLEEATHRRFLVLDEQDCWLRPELVPRLVKIVHEAALGLGFQVLMISHHDIDLFERYADRIYRFRMGADGNVEVLRVSSDPPNADSHGT